MAIDLDLVREQTPGCERVIHFNNAGSSLPPTAVIDATLDYLAAEALTGGYEIAALRADDVDRVYAAGAAMLGCEPSEIAFQQSATQAWWSAFRTIPLHAGDRVLATRAEYIANSFGLMGLRDKGVSVELIPDDEHGQTSVDALTEMLDERVRLVCATHVPTSGGLVNPVAEIGRVTKDAGATYLVDACQSAGQMPLDVDEIRCDFLAMTGRKFLRGPRGTGLLYARGAGDTDPVPLDGRAADWVEPWRYELAPSALRYESFEVSYGAKVGFGVALDYAMNIGLDGIQSRISELADRMRTGLDTIEGVSVADRGVVHSGIVTFDVANRAAVDVTGHLRTHGINTSTPTPLNAQFDLADRAPDGLVRASVHYFNTEAEVDRLLELVADAA